MTDDDAKRMISETVVETLLKLGIDAEDPVALQKDFAHLRAWREAKETVVKQSILTAVGIITAGVLGLIWLALKGGANG